MNQMRRLRDKYEVKAVFAMLGQVFDVFGRFFAASCWPKVLYFVGND